MQIENKYFLIMFLFLSSFQCIVLSMENSMDPITAIEKLKSLINFSANAHVKTMKDIIYNLVKKSKQFDPNQAEQNRKVISSFLRDKESKKTKASKDNADVLLDYMEDI